MRLNLPPFCMYWVTTNATATTRELARCFPREAVVANLVSIHRAAAVGSLAGAHGLILDYAAANGLAAAAERVNLALDVFAERLCKEHPDWVAALAAHGMSVDDLVSRCR